MSTPLRACRPHLAAAQGPRVEQRIILARTRCATAARCRVLRSENPPSCGITERSEWPRSANSGQSPPKLICPKAAVYHAGDGAASGK